MRLGINPNSSSLGVDVTLLLVGTILVSLLVTLFSTIFRLRSAAGRASAIGGTAKAPEAGPSSGEEPKT